MHKDKTLIPKGMYCYDSNGVCPYWELRKDKPNQDNGYCHYLEKGDWEDPDFGLLWDQCKLCSENNYTDDEFYEMFKK